MWYIFTTVCAKCDNGISSIMRGIMGQDEEANDSQPQPVGTDTVVPIAPAANNPDVEAPTYTASPTIPDHVGYEGSHTAETPASVVTPIVDKRKLPVWAKTAIAAAALVFTVGGASVYYFGVYQNPANVLYDAYRGLAVADHLQATGSVAFEYDVTSDLKITSVDYGGAYDYAPNANTEVTVHAEYGGKKISVGGKGIAKENGELYFKLEGIVDAFKAANEARPNSLPVTAEFTDKLAKLQNVWVKVTLDDISKNSPDQAKEMQCQLDAYKKHKNDKNDEKLELYKKHPFVTKKADKAVYRGQLGYTLSVDAEQLKGFLMAARDLPLAKDLAACTGDTQSDESIKNQVDGMEWKKTEVTAWIDQWSHQLKSIEYKGDSGTETKLFYSGNIQVSYSKAIKIDAPSGVISIDEFISRFKALSSTPVNLNQPSVNDRAASSASQAMANTVVKKAEAYNAISGEYPKTLSQFEQYPETSLTKQELGAVTVTQDFPKDSSTVGYKWCSANAGQVVYFDQVSKQTVAVAVGDGKRGAVSAFCQ